MLERDIQLAADRLRRGGVVAFPTETVYGLGASALDPAAVARIFEIKHRPRFDPLIVHLAHVDDADRLALGFDEHPLARRLAERFWPGPLTLVLPRRGNVPDLVTAGLPSVALRLPSHPIALALIRAVALPIAAPSANRFGRVSPTAARHVLDELGDQVDLVLDGGPCTVGVESTVLSLVHPQPTLLRPGGTPVEEIESIIGPIARPSHDPARPASPGQLSQHYAPRTPLRLLPPPSEPTGRDRTALLTLTAPSAAVAAGFAHVQTLDPSGRGDLGIAAANLFAALRRLDALGLDRIVAEPVPDHGLGRAINDRLRRAAHG